MFWQKLGIIRKERKFANKIVGIGQALFFFYIIEIHTILLTGKEFIINIRPNRHNSDHVAN
jgi:hypothetical protein